MSAKSQTKPNPVKDLIILFAVPVGIAVIAALVVYLPSVFANPKYDFVYSVCRSYDCRDDFVVNNSGYAVERSIDRDNFSQPSHLRYYDASDNSTRSLSSEDLKRFQLNTSSRSPDGYSLSKEQSDSGFLFWGDYDSGWYLKNGLKKKQVELTQNDSYYSNDIKFIGWVNK